MDRVQREDASRQLQWQWRVPFRTTVLVRLTMISLAAISVCLAACSDDNDDQGMNPTPTPTVIVGSGDGIALCAQAPQDQLCSFLPHNVLAPNLNQAGYSQLGAAEQRPFDNFSWQSFVALNWPATADGMPIGDNIGDHPEAPRVWHSYRTSFEVFGVDRPGGISSRPQPCAALGEDLPVLQMIAKSDDIDREPASILETTKNPLIDRNLNFVLFDVRLNAVEDDYITSNGLTTVAGQQAFMDSGATVSFPTGFYVDDTTPSGGSVGAIEIKTAWRILDVDKGDRPDRFYTMRAHVYVSAAASENGTAFCFPALLGLVGMHIIQRTSGPFDFGLDWIWSTFEQEDNAPLATNAGDPTSLSPVPTPCVAPSSAGNQYSFYDPACSSTECPPNAAPPTPQPTVGYQWAPDQPYARNYATNGTYGTQAVKCWSIFDETEQMNAVFRGKLAGTVWEHYRLINTQWQGGVENPTTENGNIPRFLNNAVLETYIQNDASCLQCHAFATTTAGQDANFSFLLGLAQLNPESSLTLERQRPHEVGSP